MIGGKRLIDFGPFLKGSQPREAPDERKLIFNELFDRNRNFFALDASHIYLLHNDTLFYYANDRLQPLSYEPDHSLRHLIINGYLYVVRNNLIISVYNKGLPAGGNGGNGGKGSAIGGDLLMDILGHAPGQDTFRLFTGSVDHLLVNKRLYRIVPDADGGLRADLPPTSDFVNNISAIEYV